MWFSEETKTVGASHECGVVIIKGLRPHLQGEEAGLEVMSVTGESAVLLPDLSCRQVWNKQSCYLGSWLSHFSVKKLPLVIFSSSHLLPSTSDLFFNFTLEGHFEFCR